MSAVCSSVNVGFWREVQSGDRHFGVGMVVCFFLYLIRFQCAVVEKAKLCFNLE